MGTQVVMLDFFGTLARATHSIDIGAVVARHGYDLPEHVREIWWSGDIDGEEHEAASASRDHYVAWQEERLLAMLAAADVHPGEYEQILADLHAGRAERVLEVYDEVPAVLAELRGRGVHLAICSNWDLNPRAVSAIHMTCQPWPSRSKKLREYMKPRSSASSASVPPAASAATLTASTSSREATPKQYSPSVCVLGSAIGSFANSANLARPSIITEACSPTSMQAAVSSVKAGLKLNPRSPKNALLRSTSATGRFTNKVRPGCAGAIIEGLQSRGFSPTCP